jgi:hypothetical protein
VPLQRRTPLRRTSAPKRGKPLRQRSAKRVEADKVRTVVRQQVIDRDRRCQAQLVAFDLLTTVGLDHKLAEWLEQLADQCGGFDAGDVHEPLPRSRGGDPLDPEQCVLVCRSCHHLIHTNPRWARESGLTR